MNEIIEKLRSQHAFQKAEGERLKSELSAVYQKQRMIVEEYIQQSNKQFAQYLNKKVVVVNRYGKSIIGYFCGFRCGYDDRDFQIYVDLTKTKKDGSPSVNHYAYCHSVELDENLKITLCNE